MYSRVPLICTIVCIIALSLTAPALATEPNVIFLPSQNEATITTTLPQQPRYEYPPVASPIVVPSALVAAAAPVATPQTATVVTDPGTGGYRVVISDGKTVTSMPVTVAAETRHADPRYYVVPPAPSNGGNGWRVIFFLFFCAAIYLGVGYYFNTKKNLRGLAAVPHIEFWAELPGLAADGVDHTKRWVLTSWARGRPAHCFNLDQDLSSAYERVSGDRLSGSISSQSGKSHINLDIGSDDESAYTQAMLDSERGQ